MCVHVYIKAEILDLQNEILLDPKISSCLSAASKPFSLLKPAGLRPRCLDTTQAIFR